MLSTLSKSDFKGYKAILASPSVGNVSQLCVDLVISSLKCNYFGMIWHEAVLPLIGADPFDESRSKICSSCDVYINDRYKLLLIQLRAPVQRTLVVGYLTNLFEYLKSVNIEDMIVLCGLYGHQRDDNEIHGGPFRYITCAKSNEKYGEQIRSYDWIRMKGNEAENGFYCPKLQGGGLTRTLFNMACKMNVSCIGLLLFCSEGDNRHDALQLLKRLNTYLKFMLDDLNTIVYPPSWKYLFGNSVPRDIY